MADDFDSITNYPVTTGEPTRAVILVIGKTAHEAAEWARWHLGGASTWKAVDPNSPVEGLRIITAFVLRDVTIPEEYVDLIHDSVAMSMYGATPVH